MRRIGGDPRDGSGSDFEPLRSALAGQYVLERELGRGGMGVVFAARDVRLGRLVAMKVLPPQPPETTETTDRFLREARTAAQLSHPSIVPVYHADEAAGFAFFVMALIDGESLADRVRERGALPVPEAVRTLRDVGWALAYAHSRGVVHRDVKPENIMIERGTNRALVTDFGIAHDARATRLTQDGHVLGTVHYMSPEQIGGGVLDGRSDLYSLGVVAFVLLSGRLPFQDEALSAVLVAHVTRPAPALRDVAPDIPEQLAAAVDRCLAKDPADRFQSCEEFATALGDPGGWSVPGSAESAMSETVSEERAAAIWRRASQLQAEASQRLERRLSNPTDRLHPDAVTGDGYRLEQVAAAAVEAGIGPEFVALAVAEQPKPIAAPAGIELTSFEEAVARRVLRAHDASLSASRVVSGAPREVLAAIGTVFQGYPYDLKLRGNVGGHPLDGGVTVFDVPQWDAMTETGPGMKFRYYLGSLGDRQLRVALRRLNGPQGGCEVTLFADLRRTVKKNAAWVAPVAALSVVGGSGIGFGALAIGLGLGAAAALPALAIGVVAGAGAAWGQGAAHRHLLRAIRRQFDQLLSDLDAAVRSRSLFGAIEPARRRPPSSPQDDIVGMGL